MDALERIDQQVKNNPVVIFMKGTPQFPMCGFSMRAAKALSECGVPFTHVNVLQDPELFENLPRYADWPTLVCLSLLHRDPASDHRTESNRQ